MYPIKKKKKYDLFITYKNRNNSREGKDSMIHLKKLLISILIPNLVGIIGSLLGNASMGFESLIKPNFAPPGFVFPIVWFILYTLMGISSYIIYTSGDPNTKKALILYAIQLFLNSLWTFFFFRLGWLLFAFIWILIMIVFVILMIVSFYKIDKRAALLQIPYLLWLIFAAVLNFSIYLLN